MPGSWHPTLTPFYLHSGFRDTPPYQQSPLRKPCAIAGRRSVSMQFARFSLAGRRWKCLAGIMLASVSCLAQTDPGPRGGAANAGGSFAGLNANEVAFFSAALGVFREVNSVSGTIPGEAGTGLGPTFNLNSCTGCHAQPATGGTSPAPFSPQVPVPNPQIAVATLDGATNTIPSFISANGPVREARFIAVDPTQLNSPLDGGVHGLFTIKARGDAPGCNLAQPDFNFQLANANVSFRIPTPVFGLGLIENTPAATLQANLSANATQKANLGRGGTLHTT